MQRHLIAFDLDETLSQSHIYKTILDQARAYQAKAYRANLRISRWSRVSKDPDAEVKRVLDKKKSLLDSNLKRIEKYQDMLEKQVSDEDVDSDSSTIALGASPNSNDSGSFFLLPPEQVTENYKQYIFDLQAQNLELIEEIDRTIQNLADEVSQCKSRADARLAKLEVKHKKFSELYASILKDVESQWPLIEKISLMCDKPLLLALINELNDAGHVIAIVTFNDFQSLVTKFLEVTCGLNVQQIKMYCFNSEAHGRVLPGKNMHLQQVIDLCESPSKSEFKNNPERVILIDDSALNVRCAREAGYGGFHFDVSLLSRLGNDIAANANNAYLAFLIAKFGYEDKLKVHIERLGLKPLIDHMKSQQQEMALYKLASMNEGSRVALRTAGILPTVRRTKSSPPAESVALKK